MFYRKDNKLLHAYTLYILICGYIVAWTGIHQKLNMKNLLKICGPNESILMHMFCALEVEKQMPTCSFITRWLGDCATEVINASSSKMLLRDLLNAIKKTTTFKFIKRPTYPRFYFIISVTGILEF